MNKEMEILSLFYELMNILEKKGFYLGFKKNKILLFSFEENKMKKICEASSIQAAVEYLVSRKLI